MSFSSNSVIAKSRAVFGRSLTPDDYVRLCDKASVADAAAYLKATPRYGAALAGVNPQTVHRGQLEALLEKSIFDIFESFHRFDYTESRAFFGFIVAQLETEQVLSAIEAVASGSTDSYISALPTFLIKFASVDLLELGRAKTFADIDRLVSGAKYAKVLRPLLLEAAGTGKIRIIECERRLYSFYYMNFLTAIEKMFMGKRREEIKRALLKSIDMENVVTCCRMRAFGESNADTVREALLPFKYRLSDETIERLAGQNDISRIEAELARIGYRTDKAAAFETVEQLTERISLDYYRRTLRMSQNSATVYFCLIEVLRIELRNIKTVIEGIRYGLSSGDIFSVLVV